MSSEGKDPRDESAHDASSDERSSDQGPPETGAPEDGATVARDNVARDEDATGSEEPTAEKSDEKSPSKPTGQASYYDDPYSEDSDDEYNADDQQETTALAVAEPKPEEPPPSPPSPPDSSDEDEGDEGGMSRMSFLEHLEELRTRLIRGLVGMIAIYMGCFVFAQELFKIVVRPFQAAVEQLPYDPPLQLTQITPTEQFYLMYIKIPLLAAIFLGSPWLMYQAWTFIAPGLYKRERRWAVPFILSTAALFILGGTFCYFIALRFALRFLMGLAFEPGVRPMISLSSYYDMFFNLHVGLGIVFQMPIVIFFFTLLRITSPAYLMRHGRYAILIIFIIAAVITPTPDVTTMLTFAAPMILLYYVGIAASYLLVLHREGRRLPWKKMLSGLLIALALVGAVAALLHFQMGYEFTLEYPWLVKPGG